MKKEITESSTLSHVASMPNNSTAFPHLLWSVNELGYVDSSWDGAGAYHTGWLYELVFSHYESRKCLELFRTFQLGMTSRASNTASQTCRDARLGNWKALLDWLHSILSKGCLMYNNWKLIGAKSAAQLPGECPITKLDRQDHLCLSDPLSPSNH